MVDKTVSVKFEALTSGYENGTKRMESATTKFAKAADTSLQRNSRGWDGLAKSARDNSAEWTKAGTAFTTFGAVSAAGLAIAGKAAVDWESAWTGVLKTVDASEGQLAGLNRGLRDMALELPASQTEIAGVAEAAGQLGIQTGNIEDFTRTMIDLGETTNVSANDAATAIARFANIMGTSQDEFSNVGSAVVELGNNYETTEREIIDMSLRLAGAGRQARLTEGEVLGLATALSSVGIEAEAGGTAYSRVLIEMGVAVDTQGEKLETFASVAGMTADEFSAAWGSDPGSAISAFVSGLGDMDAAGESLQPILEELGMTDIRVGDALRRSASASDTFTTAMETGNAAYAENIALTEEAELRYETVGAKLAIARNQVNEAAISFGDVLMPAIAGGAGALADFAGWLAELPDPVQRLTVISGSAAAGISLLGGGFLLMLPRILETKDAVNTVVDSMRGLDGLRLRGLYLAESSFGRLAKSAGAAGIALGTIAAVGTVLQPVWQGLAGGSHEAAEGLEAYLEQGANADELSGNMARGFKNLDNQVKLVFNRNTVRNVGEFFAEVGSGFGIFGGTALDDATAFFEEVDSGLTQMVADGNGAEAARILADIREAAELQGISAGQLADKLPAATAALDGYSKATSEAYQAQLDLANATDAANFPDIVPQMTDNARATEESAEAMAEAEEAAEELAQAYADLLGEMGDGAGSFVSITGALAEYDSAVQEWAQGQADATESAEDSWEDFTANHKFSLDEYLTHLEAMVTAQTNWESNMTSLVGRVSEGTLTELAKLGPEAAPLVAALADASAPELARFEESFAHAGSTAGGNIAAGLLEKQAVVDAAGELLGQGAAAKLNEALQNNESTAAQAVLDYNLKATLEVLAETDPAAASVLAQVNAIEMTEAVMDIGANVGGAEESHQGFIFAVDESSATARILANTGPGAQSVADFQYETNRKSATLLVYANTSGIYDAVGSAMYWIRSQRPVMRVGMSPIAVATGGPIALATGGPVRGAGTGTSDDVPAYNRDTGAAYALSNGEHVLTAAEVMAAGGHAEIYRMRKAMLAGDVRYDVGGELGVLRSDRLARMSAQSFSYAATASVDTSAIAAAVSGAMQSWQPVVRLGDRDFYGTMRRAELAYSARTVA